MKSLLSFSALLIFGGIANAQDTPAPKATPAPEVAKTSHATPIHFSVTGLENEALTKKAEAALATLAGVSQLKNDSKTGTFTIQYDPAKVKADTLQKALSDSGLKVNGQQTTFQIKGMMCQSCCNHLISVLGKTEGLVNVDKISHLTRQATLTFDPKKTDEAKLKAAIHTTRYKVVEAKK